MTSGHRPFFVLEIGLLLLAIHHVFLNVLDSEQGTNPCRDLTDVSGPCDVVVRAGVKSYHAISDVFPCREQR